MKTVSDVMSQALLKGACEKSNGVSDWKTLSWLFFSPQGLEFCEKNNFPSIDVFKEIKNDVSSFNIYVDNGETNRYNDANIALIGDTQGQLIYDYNTKAHKVVLMHGAKAFIVARNYAVVRLVNIGNCEVKIHKDKTALILK